MMGAKHQTGQYQASRRIIRNRVAALHRAGQPAVCWRGGGLIPPGTPYDVGHLPGATGSSLHDLAPEHRHAARGCCDGNRRHGGRVGALITNRVTATTIRNPGTATTWPA